MQVEQKFPTKRFAQAEHGALVNALLGRGKVVRGMKAFHRGENGEPSDYFVTIGPFFAEHGERPVVYEPEDLVEEQVLDLTAGFRLQPSLASEDIAVEDAGAEDPKGVLLLAEGRTLMRVANFGRAGPHQFAYLDLATGEIADLPAEGSYLATHRWHIARDDGTVDFEFTAQLPEG